MQSMEVSLAVGDLLAIAAIIGGVIWALVKYIVLRELAIRDKQFQDFKEEVLSSLKETEDSVSKLTNNYHVQDKQIAVIIAKQERV